VVFEDVPADRSCPVSAAGKHDFLLQDDVEV